MTNVYKLKKIFSDKVVIGTGSEYEYAFQITNFLNMLHDAINMVLGGYHYDPCVRNLKSYIKSLKKYIPEDSDQVWYGDEMFNHTFGIIETQLDLISGYIKLNGDIKNKIDLKSSTQDKIDKQIEDMLINIIESNKQSCHFYLNNCYDLIKSLYPVKYFN